MNPYYKILGLQPGASQEEIKKAYFKMIRKHPPESDPDGFRQLREAYEQLKNAQNAEEKPSFPPLCDPLAEKMLDQIQQYRLAKNRIKFRDACEEACHRFPDELQFLYLLITAQRQCGNTGKAVKNAELLVSRAPENKWFYRELAVSYKERGFTNKFYNACKKAYELGCRDPEFLIMYSRKCEDDRQYGQGISILLEIIRQDRKWTKNDIPQLMDTYIGLLGMNYHLRGPHLLEILDSLYRTAEQYAVYFKEYIPELCLAISRMCVTAKPGSAEYDKVMQLFSILLKTCHPSEKELLEDSISSFYYYLILEDPRIGDTLERYLEIFHDLADADPMYQKFAIIDTQLCMIEERKTILLQAEIIRREYPVEYERIADFIQKLRSESNINYLKSSLQKTYRRIEPIFSFGYYYEQYPQEKKLAMGTLINKGFEEEPYVRSHKKIGRNDPCPCGSGKKYKHCCMNKKDTPNT